MPKLLRIRNSDEVKKEVQRLFETDENARYIRRLDIILLICEGQSLRKIAILFGKNPTTVQRWVKRLNEEGIIGLRDKAGRGRPSQLSKEDREKLKIELEKSPQELGYSQSRWDGKLLSYHLKQEYGVNLKVRRCQILFKELGFSLQRPRKMPVGADPEKREVFKKTL